MKYTKVPLSYTDQADLLLSRGLIADRDELIGRLEQVSYYRLSGYLYPFRKGGGEELEGGTSLQAVWDRYVFDRQLRVLIMDAVERIEVGIKTQLATVLALKYGAFAHLDRGHLPNIDLARHRRLVEKIQREEVRSHEVFVRHYHRKYTSETNLPLWMACEVMDFGSMLTVFRGCEGPVKQELASYYGIADRVLESWLVAINTLRNLCAHHARLWDRRHGTAAMIPRKRRHPEWHEPVAVGQSPNWNFAQFTILRYLLDRIAPQSGWAERMENLWQVKHTDIPIERMGFPQDWKECPIWKK